MEYPPSSWDQASISAWPPLTRVYLDLHGNEVMSGSLEAVNLYIETRHNNFSSLFASVWLCGFCLKQGSENMVLVVLLQIGAKDFTAYIRRTSGVSGFHETVYGDVGSIEYERFIYSASGFKQVPNALLIVEFYE